VKNQVVDQAKSTLSQARDSAASSLSDSKGRLADQVTHVADAFRNTTDHLRQQNQPQLAGYADGVARQAERLAGYLRNADFRAIWSSSPAASPHWWSAEHSRSDFWPHGS
jgi:hypothetical protein